MNNKFRKENGTSLDKNPGSRNHKAPSDNQNTQKLQEEATDLKNHSHDLKSESEYDKGALDDLGQDARRSREKAERFQKEKSI